MHILITGGTGFVGSALIDFFLQKNYSITILSRKKSTTYESVRVIESINEIDINEKIDVIINLAGSPINKRWNEGYKANLIKSRLDVTQNIIALIKLLIHKPELLISASAIGYYGTQNNDYIDENSIYIDDFCHQLCDLWEKEALKSEKLGVRTCVARLGVVLGENGGALEQILPAFKLGIGGNISSGKQFFSWIHIEDVINIFHFFITNKEQKGIYNLTSPTPVTNSEFTKTLGRVLNRPSFFTVPTFVIKMIFGEMGDKLLLNGAAIYPKKLLDNDYEFKFKTIDIALQNIIDK